MKLMVNCMHCENEKWEKVKDSTKPIPVTAEEILESHILVSVVNDNIYYFKCKKGHDNIIYLNNPKFEILYESGINAMLDGYFAESILTLTAALERTYEFALEIISNKNEIDSELYNKTFKLIANQSERQIGGFYMLYLNQLKKVPPVFKKEQVEFRNKVIHKGLIPSFEETNEYAKEVFYMIKQIFIDVVEFTGEDFFLKHQNRKYENATPKLKELHSKYQSPRASMSRPTMICHMLVLELYRKIEYESSLERSKYWKEKKENPFLTISKFLEAKKETIVPIPLVQATSDPTPLEQV